MDATFLMVVFMMAVLASLGLLGREASGRDNSGKGRAESQRQRPEQSNPRTPIEHRQYETVRWQDAEQPDLRKPVEHVEYEVILKRSTLCSPMRRGFQQSSAAPKDTSTCPASSTPGNLYDSIGPAHECVDRPNLPCPACERARLIRALPPPRPKNS